MPIRVRCPGCGQSLNAPDRLAGKTAKCPACGNPVTIPAAAAAVATPPDVGTSGPPAASPPPLPASPPPPARPSFPAPAASGGMSRMKCESCGGVIEYQSGQGYFECRSCGSRYNATSDSAGNSIVQTIELRELTEQMRGVRGEMSLERLQKKAEALQDNIDYKYVEFFHSWPSKAGRAAVLLWMIGALVTLFGLASASRSMAPLLIGLALIGLGVALFFLVFKKAEAAHMAETQAMKAQELEPVYQQIKRVAGGLEGGEAFLGYRESTGTPQRYCVNCHSNVTPDKGKGGLGGGFHGANLMLTVLTCGMWIPAWIILGLIGSAGGAAKRAAAKGCCPICRTTPLFPARIKNV
jgi:ribosomal protein L37AE/L43A